MVESYVYKNATWVDAYNPTDEEIDDLIATYEIDPRIKHEITTASPTPDISLSSNTILLVLHFPVYKQSHSDKEENTQEVDFIVGNDFIITVRYDTIDTLYRFAKNLEVHTITSDEQQKDEEPITGATLLFAMIADFYQSTRDELRYTKDWMHTIEKQIFRGEEREMVVEISHASRVLLDFQKTLKMHDDLFGHLRDTLERLFDGPTADRFRRLEQEQQQLRSGIDHDRRVIRELRETNESMLSTRQNEIIKNLTVMAFVTFPVTMIAALFGMTLKNTPIRGHPYDFPIVIGIMLVLVLLSFVYFKHKQWL